MPFVERLANTMTPNRVLALCQLVAYRGFTKEELSELLQPTHLNNRKEQFNNVFSFANKNLIEENPLTGKIQLKVNKEDIGTHEAFRRTVSKIALQNTNLMFYRFTSWYLMHGEKVFAKNSKDLADSFNSEMNFDDDTPNKYNDTNINAWKTWACFLGYGYSHAGNVIPNTAVRLMDLIVESKEITKRKFIPFAEFIDWLGSVSPELDGGEVFNRSKGRSSLPSQTLSLGLSSGLRALHDQGVITLKYQSDAIDTWFLTECKTHEIIMGVSEIRI